MSVDTSVRKVRPNSVLVLCWMLSIVAFFLIRAVYWLSIDEEPFSDMRDLANVAKSVLCCFDFSFSPFWQTYSKATVPLFGAVVFGLFGVDNFFAWRLFQTLFTFWGALWLAREIDYATKSRLLGVLFLSIVALSSSSIFWSYKFATEGISEAFIYLCLASFLYAKRLERFSPLAYFFSGLLSSLAILNRPNMIIFPPIIILSLIVDSRLRIKLINKRLLVASVAFVLGLSIPWGSWIARSYSLYGKFLPLTTHGVYSFLWELGGVSLQLKDGTVVTRTAIDLQNEAPTRFRNDYEAHRYAQRFARAWLNENWRTEYPGIIKDRIMRSVTARSIALSRVARSPLFPSGMLNAVTLDKSAWISILGMTGLALLPFVVSPILLIIPGLNIGQWLFGTLFIGDPRMYEPGIPLILFGVIIPIWAVFKARTDCI